MDNMFELKYILSFSCLVSYILSSYRDLVVELVLKPGNNFRD